MARQAGESIDNNFVGGLVTQATGLNFPENSCTATENCVFAETGSVSRRLGLDFETGYTETTVVRNDATIHHYLWKNVASDGSLSFVVVQNGRTLYFYDTTEETSLSAGKLAGEIDISTFSPSGAISPDGEDCDFATGLGYLFVSHPDLNPFYVEYTPSTDTFTATEITVRIRDFEGLDDDLQVDERPTALTSAHRYNLGNQGWSSSYNLTSSTSTTIGTGSKVFTTNLAVSATPITVGDRVKIFSTANHNNYMLGVVTAFVTTSLTVLVQSVNGAGTLTDWNITENPNDILTWNDALGNFPSNADIWWTFKNSSDAFDTSTINNVGLDKSRANTGHFILPAFNQDRSSASGIAGITTVTAGAKRPSTVAFYAGRVWYAGVNALGFNSRVYYSQILEDVSLAGECFQANDPTSEDSFDLLPTDGGAFDIPGTGIIYRLIPFGDALLVFAETGVWAISGSTGLGFAANDFKVAFIEAIRSISRAPFVDVNGTPIWWNDEGIYRIEAKTDRIGQATGRLEIVSLTDTKIKNDYIDIPLISKLHAKGSYNPFTHIIQWCYRSDAASTIEGLRQYDTILNFNTLSGAFYYWTFDADADVKIHGIVTGSIGGGTTLDTQTVISAASDNVIDASGNQVVVYGVAFADNIQTVTKYIVSYASGSNDKLTFAEASSADYKDWITYDDEGVDYESFFITGYRLRTKGQRNFQVPYIFVFSDGSEETSYGLQALWDFANDADSGQITSTQVVTHTTTGYDFLRRKLLVRGRGAALQYKFSSVSGQPFNILGWSSYEQGTTKP